MKRVVQSAEHHLLAMVEKLSEDRNNKHAWRFSLLKPGQKSQVKSDPAQLQSIARSFKDTIASLSDEIEKHFSSLDEAYLYSFDDLDLLLVLDLDDASHRDIAQKVQRELTARDNIHDFLAIDMASDFYTFEKIVEEKYRLLKLFDAMAVMADENKIASISPRRKKRDGAVVLIVEDDWFTASYASSFLTKDYKTIVARTGEEAIVEYVENAPDIVFMDIHLPGMTGEMTLDNIVSMDPDAHVVMVSVDTKKDTILNTARDGAAGFIKKPFSKDRLLAMVKRSPHVRKVKSPPVTSDIVNID